MARLLYVVNKPGFLVSHRFDLAKAARDAGHEVHAAGPEGDQIDVIEAAGISYHRVPLSRSGMNPAEDLGLIRALAQLYRRLGPDLVHHVTIKPVVYGGIAARMVGVPCAVSAVSGLGNLFISEKRRHRVVAKAVTRLYRYALGHPNSCTIIQNPDDRRFLLENDFVAASSTLLIRGSGVDVESLLPRQEPEGVPIAVLAGRLVVDKGVREFVEAARTLKQREVPVRMVLVGPADPHAKYAIAEEELRGWETEGLVEWWGYRSDMHDILRTAMLAVLPSYNEGLPKFLLEAAAAGVPIVSTDVPGCREVALHGKNALVVPPQTSLQLADAIERLLGDAQLRARFASEGRRMAEEEFSLRHVIEQHLSAYTALLS